MSDAIEESFILRGFVQKLRSDERFSYSPIVTIIEAQLSAVQAHRMALELNMFRPIHHFSYDRNKIPVGVPTGPTEKLRMVQVTSDRLCFNRIRFAADLVHFTHDIPLNETISRFKKQLSNYVVEAKEAPNPAFGETKYGATGKTTTGADDLAVVFQLGLFWIPIAMNDALLKEHVYQRVVRDHRGVEKTIGVPIGWDAAEIAHHSF